MACRPYSSRLCTGGISPFPFPFPFPVAEGGSTLIIPPVLWGGFFFISIPFPFFFFLFFLITTHSTYSLSLYLSLHSTQRDKQYDPPILTGIRTSHHHEISQSSSHVTFTNTTLIIRFGRTPTTPHHHLHPTRKNPSSTTIPNWPISRISPTDWNACRTNVSFSSGSCRLRKRPSGWISWLFRPRWRGHWGGGSRIRMRLCRIRGMRSILLRRLRGVEEGHSVFGYANRFHLLFCILSISISCCFFWFCWVFSLLLLSLGSPWVFVCLSVCLLGFGIIIKWIVVFVTE